MNKIKLEIFNELVRNSRINNNLLSKYIKKPPHIVSYHRDKLYSNYGLKNEIIVNYDCLGYQEFVVYLKIFRYSDIREKIKNFITKHPNTKWAAEVAPEYNLRINVIAKQLTELESIIDEIEELCEGNILNKQIMFVQEYFKITKTQKVKKAESTSKTTMDAKEKKLLLSLFKKPDSKLLELSKASGYSIEGARNKIKEWTNKGLISAFSVKYDKKKFGINLWCQLLIKVNNIDKNGPVLTKFLLGRKEFGKSRRLFGSYDAELTLFVNSQDELFDNITELERTLDKNMSNYMLLFTGSKILDHRIPKVILD